MKRSAFTLVELLIVVVILGILAAVVVPQFSDASTDARISSLGTNLATIRGQLELYKLQHNGNYPALLTFTAQMTAGTKADGTAGADFGPYLQRIPNNPFSNTNDVSTDAAASDKAWHYTAATGAFKANDGGTTNGVTHASM
ncbi:MAG: prepilin-type N-terminal cleavage/methylation domain-containing protein [Planctomycetota bacterium]